MTRITIPITTNSGGGGEATKTLYGFVPGIHVALGAGMTSVDVIITELVTGRSILTVSGVTEDTSYPLGRQLLDGDGAPLSGAFGLPMVFGGLHVVLANGGNVKKATITLYVDR